MWYGIYLEGNAAVNVGNYTVIEDAIYAISTDGTTNMQPAITVANTLFNKNEVGIFISPNTNNLSTTINVTSSIFTCRTIPETGTGTIYNNATNFNNLFTNFQTNWASLPTTPAGTYGTAQTPFGYQSNAGIVVNGCSNSSPVNIGVNGTTAQANIFDYLNYGVLAIKSNVDISGNQFQNMPGDATYNPTSSTAHLTATGVGIYADNYQGTPTPNIPKGTTAGNNAITLSKQVTVAENQSNTQIENMNNGVYMVRLMGDGNILKTQRVIVTK